MPDGGYEKAAFDGGFYLTYFYWDHDEEENRRLYQEAVEYIEGSGISSWTKGPAIIPWAISSPRQRLSRPWGKG